MAGNRSDAPSPPTMAQKMMIALRSWASAIDKRADGVAEKTQDVGPLAPDEIADLAADEDERGGHQRLERDRRLHAADGRVEIPNHRRDRDVHQRRVDDEHEHRHRQQDGEPRTACCLLLRRRYPSPRVSPEGFGLGLLELGLVDHASVTKVREPGDLVGRPAALRARSGLDVLAHCVLLRLHFA